MMRPSLRSSSSTLMPGTTMPPFSPTFSASHWSSRARTTVYDCGGSATRRSEASSNVVWAPSPIMVMSSRATGRSNGASAQSSG